MTEPTTTDVRGELATALADLPEDMDNDAEFLVSLLGDALEDNENFEDDYDRALWAVSQWCQELNVLPDLDDYDTGRCVPPGAQKGQHPRLDEKYHDGE